MVFPPVVDYQTIVTTTHHILSAHDSCMSQVLQRVLQRMIMFTPSQRRSLGGTVLTFCSLRLRWRVALPTFSEVLWVHRCNSCRAVKRGPLTQHLFHHLCRIR